MSRVGKQLIPIPGGTEVALEGEKIRIKGPKGQLEQMIHPATSVEKQETNLQVLLKDPQDREEAEEGVEAALLRGVREREVAQVPLADHVRAVARRVLQILGHQLVLERQAPHHVA